MTCYCILAFSLAISCYRNYTLKTINFPELVFGSCLVNSLFKSIRTANNEIIQLCTNY